MLNGKDLRKLVVPLAALIVFAFQHFAKVNEKAHSPLMAGGRFFYYA